MWTNSHNKPEVEYYLNVEATTRCNAACPGCGRFIPGTPVKHPHLKLEDLTVENLDKWLGKEIIAKVNDLKFCGDFGDPCSNPYILDIIGYVANIRKDMHISINSNGGNRNPKFWKELASYLKLFKSHSVIFGIDGLEDTNHIYRRNIKWSTLMGNVKAFIGNGGHATWDFIKFQHNEHQVDEAQKLSTKLGFKYFAPKRSLGQEDQINNTTWDNPVYDRNGKKIYDISLPKSQVSKTMKKIKRGSDSIDVESILKYDTLPKYKPMDIDYSKYSHIDKTPVKCEVVNDNHKGLYLTPSGTLLPCCYTGYALADMSAEHEVSNQLLQGIGGPDKVNLNKTSYSNIFKTFDSFFYKGWDKSIEGGKCILCVENCGHNPVADRLFTEGIKPSSLI